MTIEYFSRSGQKVAELKTLREKRFGSKKTRIQPNRINRLQLSRKAQMKKTSFCFKEAFG